MTMTIQTQTQTTNNSSGYTSPTRRGSSTSSSSPSSSRRSSWDEKRMDEQEREREIFMGALVSPGSGGGYDCEKSIDVPCIILSTSSLLLFSFLHLSLALRPILYYPSCSRGVRLRNNRLKSMKANSSARKTCFISLTQYHYFISSTYQSKSIFEPRLTTSRTG